MESDCMGCEKRYPGCHAKCESYIEAKKRHAELVKKKRLDDEFTAFMAELAKRKKNVRH